MAVLAFVPMLLTSIGYSELNKADPDCGTTFTWATRAFGPRTGWAGGWAIVAADVLVMASLAQVASQYVFLLFGANGHREQRDQRLGAARRRHLDHPDDRHLLRRHRGVGQLPEGPARHRAHDAVRAVHRRPGQGRHRHAPPGHLTPSIQWLNPFHISSFSAFASGIILMVFIYWGWDTAVAVNEETKDKTRTPGLAAIFSTFILLVTYALVIFSIAGVRRRQDHRQRPGQHRQRGRRAVGPGQRHLRHDRLRPGLLPPAAAHGAVLGRRVHPDHDPAHRADHAVDGGLQGAAQVVRHGPPAVHDPHGVHGRHGR